MWWVQELVGAGLIAAVMVAARVSLGRVSRRQVTALWTWRSPVRLYRFCGRCHRPGRLLEWDDVVDLAEGRELPGPHVCDRCLAA